jgi:hypothetical protein
MAAIAIDSEFIIGRTLMLPFTFHTKLEQTLLLGKRARNLRMLIHGIREVPDASIYHHTHRVLLQHHYLSPEPPNDFAYWATEVLNDKILGERLWSIDIIQFGSIGALRERLLEVLEDHAAGTERIVDAPRGEEFHFLASRIFVLPTPFVVSSLGEFREALQRVTINAVYYHMFDARLRLGRGDNDFARWLDDEGYRDLAAEIRGLDPYTQTLEGLRQRLTTMVRDYEHA